MQISSAKKNKLKKLLASLSPDDEKQELEKLDFAKVKEIVSFFEEESAESEDNYKSLLEGFNQYAKSVRKHHEATVEGLNKFTQALGDKLDQMGGTITTSYEKNKPFNAAGVYKDIINQLSAVNESIQKKPVPVWNWPQYAGVSVRNKNFANIDPAVDSLNIGEYDYVNLALSVGNTVETYTFKYGGASGTLVATVVITYVDSTRATFTSVVKTPVLSSN